MSADTVTLTDNATNYVEVELDGSAVSANTSSFSSNKIPLYEIVTLSGEITTVTDRRPQTLSVGKTIADGNLSNDIAPRLPLSAALSIGVGSEASNTIQVTITFSVTSKFAFDFWLADSSSGWETSTAPDGDGGDAVAASTGTIIREITADKRYTVVTDSNGVAVIDVTDSGADTWYLILEFMSKRFASAAITFS